MFASLRKSVGVNVDRARYYFFIVFKAYLAGDLSEVVSATLEKNSDAYDERVPWPGA